MGDPQLSFPSQGQSLGDPNLQILGGGLAAVFALGVYG